MGEIYEYVLLSSSVSLKYCSITRSMRQILNLFLHMEDLSPNSLEKYTLWISGKGIYENEATQ